MSDIWIPYGGGADLDPVTATAADVRKGKTIVDKDGNPISGTMPDIAGRTITPTTSQQTLNGGGYLTGNVVVPGFTPPPANVIKKGYVLNVFGIKITGSFEGWVPTPQDLYYNGTNPAGFTINSNCAAFQNTRIVMTSESSSSEINTIQFTKSYNVQSYSKLIFEGKFESIGTSTTSNRTLRIYIKENTSVIASFSAMDANLTSVTLDITNLKTINSGAVIFTRIKQGNYFTRIRLA
jgi:hypothetical protein|nr:MAG TPA: tail protein [Caudoviricetes sp.]